MPIDPFEQFERSRGGMLIPVAVFVIGVCLTVAVVRSLHVVSSREDAAIKASDGDRSKSDASSLTQQTSISGVSETDPQPAPVEMPNP